MPDSCSFNHTLAKCQADSADFVAALSQRICDLIKPPKKTAIGAAGSSGLAHMQHGARAGAIPAVDPVAGSTRAILTPVSILWKYTVDNYLIKSVDSHTQVRVALCTSLQNWICADKHEAHTPVFINTCISCDQERFEIALRSIIYSGHTNPYKNAQIC